MSWLVDWLGAAFVYALGWTLLHSLWQGALVAAVLALVLAITPRWSANARYLCAVLALGAVMVLGALTYSRYHLMVEAAVAEALASSAEPVLSDSRSAFSPEALAYWLNRHMSEIVLLWMIGFALFLTRYCGGLLYCHRLKTWLSGAAEPEWQARVEVLAQSIGVSRTVVLKLSHHVMGPCVIGHLKPVVLFPIGLMSQLSCDELEAILRHELAHIRRNDYLVGLVQSLIKTLYFFNWPVLWISARIDHERENACDDIAADGCKSRIFYAETLTRFSSLTTDYSASNDGGLTMSVNGKHHLVARIRRLFESDYVTGRPFEGLLSSLLLLMLGLFLSVHSQAEDQYPEINTLDDVSVGQLVETFKGQVTEAGDDPHIVTKLKPTDDYQALSETEQAAFANYFREALWQESYQDMERVEHFSHLEEPEWLEVRQLWFEQNYGHFINALKGADFIAEQYERRVGDHPNPIRFTRFDSGRMEAEIPMAVIHDLKRGPNHEVDVEPFVLRHLGSEGVLLVMKKGDAINEVALGRRLGLNDFEDGGIFAGQMSYLSHNDDVSSNQVSSFVAADDFYQVWLDGDSLTYLERGEQANAVDALSGFRVNQKGVLEVAFHPERSRYASNRLVNFMNSKTSPYSKKVKSELNAHLAKLPSNLHDYLYQDEHVERHFLARSLREGVAIGDRQKEHFANMYQKTRVEFLLNAVKDPERDALEAAHNSIEVWPTDATWVNIYPMVRDEPLPVFDLVLKDQPFTQAVSRVVAECGETVSSDRYRSVEQTVSLYGFETHCEQLKRVLDQMAERHGAMAAR